MAFHPALSTQLNPRETRPKRPSEPLYVAGTSDRNRCAETPAPQLSGIEYFHTNTHLRVPSFSHLHEFFRKLAGYLKIFKQRAGRLIQEI